MPIRVECQQPNQVLFVPGSIISEDIVVNKSTLKIIDDMPLDAYNLQVQSRDALFQPSDTLPESEKERLEALHRIYSPERFQMARKHMTVDIDP